ncbi:MAG TPA: hypothetical protein VMF13_20995 [Luteitalea sp.]|nr:hypothetical protein [Luteitalea sp.]
MTSSDHPGALLVVARQLSDSPDLRTSPWATRAIALLVRQAMELWLAQYWDATSPAVASVSRKSQFLLLTDRLPEDAAAFAHATWSQLSHACHHRVFDLEPTIAQSIAWIEAAEAFGDALRATARTDH